MACTPGAHRARSRAVYAAHCSCIKFGSRFMVMELPSLAVEFPLDAPITEDNVLVVEMHAVSDPVTILSQPATPREWSSEAGIKLSRSGNHYSNGESRLTPEFEWNGWENVSPDKDHFAYSRSLSLNLSFLRKTSRLP